jgi:serine/threonine protein kinase, bacterial
VYQPPGPPGYPAYGVPPPRRSALPLVIGAVVLTVLLAGAIAFAALQFADAPRRPEAAPTQPSATAEQGPPEWQPYVDAGKEFALALMSVSAATIDADIEKILAGSTGAFHDDFEERSEDFKKVTRESNVSTSASVNEAGLEDSSEDAAQVLVAATTKVTNDANANQEPRQWRLRMTIEKVGDEFKTSKVEFVP